MISMLVNPQFIQSTADFYQLIKLGETSESLVLDFKKDLDRLHIKGEGSRKSQIEFCRDIAQFSNTLGGCLLLGVEEGHNGLKKTAAKIHPLDDFDTRREWIEQAVHNFLIPSTVPFKIQPIKVADGHIIAINIPAYRHLVWLWDRESKSMQCIRRTNHGKEYLNPDEVEAHLMDSSRACKLAFLRAVEESSERTIHLAAGVWAVMNRGPVGSAPLVQQQAEIWLGRIGEHEFEINIKNQSLNGTVTVRAPYGLIQESWVTIEGHIGLLLKFRLIASQSRDSLTMAPL